ncbi:hypothetical protein MUP46_00080 [Patescibacteria group bacterium]|nr:hypothetical protein [Patescibacteria group bacterium]
MKKVCPNCGEELLKNTVRVTNLADSTSKISERKEHWSCSNCEYTEEIVEKN